MTAILEAKGISRTYTLSGGMMKKSSKLQAVRDVSLYVNRGETCGIVGESGCGKSTVARILLGLEQPDAGQITLDGQAIASIPRAELSRRVQPVFQDPYSTLNPRRSILETVIHPLNVHKVGDAPSRDRRARKLLDQVGLPKRSFHAFPNQLSGGQRQRVAIARALALDPDILVCDEPTSALDVSIQAQILNLIQDLQRDLGVAMVFISHNLGVIEHVADRVAVMYLGRVVETGETRKLMQRPEHPYTRALLESVLTPDPELGLPDLDLGRSFPDPTNIPSGCSFHPRCAFRTSVCEDSAPEPRQIHGASVECHLAGNLGENRLATVD
ncbi:ABC transporter ATP-binding protein [Primorskyibacter sedentarius]|nr:oligopeptide/dipeptide ABC transporter ATP-binding protein [Primorskyibacter sedentarius]